MSENIQNDGKELVIDLSYLNEIASGSVEFMIDMISIFLEQTPVYFEQLTQAVENQDWKSAGDIAHKIKPTLAFMGADAAKDSMAEIERKARNLESVETLEADVKRLKAFSETLYSKLEERKKEFELKL